MCDPARAVDGSEEDDDDIDQESNNKKIKYGDKTWEPTFWPNDMLVWSENRKNFSNIKTQDFTGKLSILMSSEKLSKGVL